MTKVTFKCNQCGTTARWYKSFIDETIFTRIDRKIYCWDCIKKIAHIGVDLA